MKFTRYLLWNFFKMFCLIFIGAAVMFIVIDFVGNIKSWFSQGMKNVAEYYLNYLPYIVYLISPVVLFLAVIASVGNMSRHLELTAVQSAGRSMFRALVPIAVFGLIVTLLTFVLGETILPESNHRRFEIMETKSQKKKNQRVKERRDFAFIDARQASWFFRYYSGVNKSGRDVVVLLREEGRLVERIDAKRIHWGTANEHDSTDTDSCWIFERGFVRTFPPTGEIRTQEFKSYPLKNTVSRPEDLINERQTGEELNALEIRHRLEILRRSGEDTKKLETAYHSKFANPWCNMIVLLIGMALCHRFSRSGGLSQRFGIGLFFVFSYYIVIRLGLKMGENGAFDPWISAYGPHAIFACVACFMLGRSFRL